MGRSSDDLGDNITPGEQRAHPLSVGPPGREDRVRGNPNLLRVRHEVDHAE